MVENSKHVLRKDLINLTQNEERIMADLLTQFETIIENNNCYTIKHLKSDNSKYDYRQDISLKNLLGNSSTYSLYFNEEITETFKYEKTSIEQKTYDGLATSNSNSLIFKMISETTTKKREIETKNTLYLYSPEDSTSYQKIITSSENERDEIETEFTYEIVTNGLTTFSYNLEIETDTKTKNIELSIDFNNKEYSITRFIKNDETYFSVELEDELKNIESISIYKKQINNGYISYQLIQTDRK